MPHTPSGAHLGRADVPFPVDDVVKRLAVEAQIHRSAQLRVIERRHMRIDQHRTGTLTAVISQIALRPL
jgi:hypothetical protein